MSFVAGSGAARRKDRDATDMSYDGKKKQVTYFCLSVMSVSAAPSVECHVTHITYDDLELDFNKMLGRIHRSLLPKLGVVFYHYPHHYRFVTETGAKHLVPKWKDSFRKKGLTVSFVINTEEKFIQATVEEVDPELIKASTVSATPVAAPALPPLPQGPFPVGMFHPYYAGVTQMPQYWVAPMPYWYHPFPQ